MAEENHHHLTHTQWRNRMDRFWKKVLNAERSSACVPFLPVSSPHSDSKTRKNLFGNQQH